jgi:o-succinylbenzoate---CoA ligase
VSRPGLRALPAGPGTAPAWEAALAAALDGSGPALLPVPDGPGQVRDQLLQALRPDDPTTPADVDGLALVVPTSGSTGEPKGVLLTAAAVRASAAATARRLDGPGDWLLALPLTHVAGQMVLARAVLGDGRTTSVAPGAGGGFDPAAFAEAAQLAAQGAAARGRPLYVSLVPTQVERLLASGVDLSPFDAVLLGGSSAPADLLARARDAGSAVVTTYGMSETCGGCVYDGVPLDGVRVDVDQDDGRVLLSGPTLFSGYRLRPDLTREALDAAGRMRTADLGRWDGERLRVLGRIDDVVVTGGEKVVPALVESVLDALAASGSLRPSGPWVVVGVPDDVWGQRVVAVTGPPPAGAVPSVDDLRAAARDRLTAASLPREVVVLDPVPVLASGKVDRLAVRAQAVAATGRTTQGARG